FWSLLCRIQTTPGDNPSSGSNIRHQTYKALLEKKRQGTALRLIIRTPIRGHRRLPLLQAVYGADSVVSHIFPEWHRLKRFYVSRRLAERLRNSQRGLVLPIVAKLIGHNRSYRDIAGY